MKLINLHYDLTFKHLMENKRLAILVFSTILEEVIEALSLRKQEYIAGNDKLGLTLFRLDLKTKNTRAEGQKTK